MPLATSHAMLPGVGEAEPDRLWFGRGGCVEKHGDGSYAVFVRGELLGIFEADDVASRDVLIAVVLQGGERGREEVARAFRVSQATVGRVVTRFARGGYRAVADCGQRGGHTVRTPKLRERLWPLFEQGMGPRRSHRAVAKLASYGSVQSMYAEWIAERVAQSQNEAAATLQQPLALPAANDAGVEQQPVSSPSTMEPEPTAPPTPEVAEAPPAATNGTADSGVVATMPAPAEPALPQSHAATTDAALDTDEVAARTEQASSTVAVEQDGGEPTLEEVAPPAHSIVQHLGTWLVRAMMNALGVYQIAARCRRDSASMPTLRAAVDAAAIAFTLGEGCVEGARRIETPSVGTLLRHPGGMSASWTRRVLHAFADEGSVAFQATMASRLLARSADGEAYVWLYVDNHMRPYTGRHTIRQGWRMQDKRPVPGTTDFYVHDETGCPLWRVSTTSNDSLTAWLMPVVEFARLSLGEHVTPVLDFDRGGAFPEIMATLRDEEAEFVTYERRPYAEIGATEFRQSLWYELPSQPRRPTLIHYTEAPRKNLGSGRGRVRRIAMLTEDGEQVNLLAVSSQPAEVLIRRHLARWGMQENQFKHGVERWGFNNLDGRRVEDYPPDAIIPNPDRRRIERVLKLSHTTEGEALRKLVRMQDEDPDHGQIVNDIKAAMERQQDLMALRASVPRTAKVSETSLAGKLKRHELHYKNVLDMLRVVLANVESDCAVLLAQHLDRPREAKKLLATLFGAPGTVHLGSRSVTVRLIPAATAAERAALDQFLRDVSAMNLTLPGDPDRRSLRCARK
jgi:hypothetical protein